MAFPDSVFKDLEKQILSLKNTPTVYNEGRIIAIGDGIALVSGLPNVMYNEIVNFPHDVKGIAFNLDEDKIGVIVLGEFNLLREGDLVTNSGQILEIPASDLLLGRVVNPLGKTLDGKKEIKASKYMPLEKIAPGVIRRQPVNSPLQTGVMSIDSLIPIGRGQRELIIGDRGTGKTTIAIDTIINQKEENVICIYVAIGQKAVRVARIHEKLQSLGAMKYTIIVSADASEPASMQYIAPYAGVAMAEYFLDKGKDVLIVYDDLSKHAWAYRQLSLLLKRPSGREAYPGDIFYLHSRLLERACRISDKFGGGSITALPIIETQAGDVSAYIPTNIISITDGQIILDSDLFFAGIRPAINAGLSVSRVGGAAQIKAMRKVAGQLRLELAQYRELASFTQFSTDLDVETKKKIDRGSRISEIFKQPQNEPLPIEHQVLIIWSTTKGHLDDIPVNEIRLFTKKLITYLKTKHPGLLNSIKKEKEISEKLELEIVKVINKFKKLSGITINVGKSKIN